MNIIFHFKVVWLTYSRRTIHTCMSGSDTLIPSSLLLLCQYECSVTYDEFFFKRTSHLSWSGVYVFLTIFYYYAWLFCIYESNCILIFYITLTVFCISIFTSDILHVVTSCETTSLSSYLFYSVVYLLENPAIFISLQFF